MMAATVMGNGAYPAEPIGAAVAAHGGLVQVDVVLAGVTPLIHNAMPVEVLLALRDKEKKPRMAAKPALRDEAAAKVHRFPDGRPHVPLNALWGTLINAGQFVRLDGKRQVSTAKKTILPGMLTVLSTELPLTLHDGRTPAPWEVDIQQGRNPNGGEAVCLVRPRFDEWQFACTLEVDQEQMSLPLARQLVDIAGRRVGLLEYRPACRGTFGRFHVVTWNVVGTAATV
jgi:hypothetical protein